MVIDQYAVIFIHINRTGGTSVERAFGFNTHLPVDKGHDHSTPTKLIRKLGRAKWERYFKFAIVRNPWDRLVSVYQMRKGYGMIPEMSFDEWLGGDSPACDRYPNSPLDPRSWWMHQVNWITDGKGREVLDFVGRYERLAEDFATVCRRVGADVTLPRLNSFERSHYSSFYDAALRQRVADLCRPDIERFGYTFEDG
jgi:hypothetical protein